MTDTQTHTVPVVFPGTLPIPVGHRIQVFYLMRDVGLFGAKIELQEHAPLVHDLTTDIWFGDHWQLAPGDRDGGLFTPRSSELPRGVTVGRSFRGTVQACVVATWVNMPTQRTATTLHVEVE